MVIPVLYTWQEAGGDLLEAILFILLLLFFLWLSRRFGRQGGSTGERPSEPEHEGEAEEVLTSTQSGVGKMPADRAQDRRTDSVMEILEAEPLLLSAMKSHAGLAHSKFQDTSVTRELAHRIALAIDPQALQMFRIGASQQDLPFNPKRISEMAAVPYITEHTAPALMTGPEQLNQVLPSELLQSDDEFMAQYLQGNLHVLQSYEERVEEAILEVLLDGSQSMEDPMRGGLPRHVWARGVAVNLLLRAVRGEASFMFRVFDGEPHKLMRATTPDEALAVIDFILSSGYTGGGTNILAAVKQAVKDIRGGGVFQNADILVVSDGDDSSMDDTAEVHELLGDIRLHVALIGRESAALKRIAATYKTFS